MGQVTAIDVGLVALWILAFVCNVWAWRERE